MSERPNCLNENVRTGFSHENAATSGSSSPWKDGENQRLEAAAVQPGLSFCAHQYCSEPDLESIESLMRPNCKKPDGCTAKTPGKHCSPCTFAANRADPEFERRRAEGLRRRLETDPEFRAAHVKASSERLREWRSRPGVMVGAHERSRANLAKANTPEAIAARTALIRKQRVGWCPDHRYDEYRRLSRRMPAADAKRIILEDEAASARRQIAEFTQRQRERAAREKAQAY
jgi:hypothetical protein